MTASPGPTPLPVIAGVQDELRALAIRVRAAAWRSYRFSWFTWGFLVATIAGEGLVVLTYVLFPVVTTTSTLGGSYTTFTLPIWIVPLTQTPAVAVLGLAIRELLLARREAQGSPLSPHAPHLSAEEAEDPSWTFLVQKAQQRITHVKNETDWSFPPILVGGLVFAELLIVNVLPSGALLFFVLLPLTGAVLSVLLWLLYRIARRWIRGYQTLLDRLVGEFATLEAEFFWHFAGTQPSP
ncbi:MAG: hypothetical protein WB984_04385 [Thermoplasmata archaeon]